MNIVRELACGHCLIILLTIFVSLNAFKHVDYIILHFYFESSLKVFHLKCIDKWLTTSNMICPVCKRSAVFIQPDIEEGQPDGEGSNYPSDADAENGQAQYISASEATSYTETSRLIDA